MKKLLLTLGTIASIAAPVAAVVACAHKDEGINWSTIDETNVITVPGTGSGKDSGTKVIGTATDTALAGTVVGTPKGAGVTLGGTGTHTSNGGTGVGTSMLPG